jgi:hypothetical protein
MTNQQKKILLLAFDLYPYWRPTGWSNPDTPESWACAIAEITHDKSSIKINNFITMEIKELKSISSILYQLRLIDDQLVKNPKYLSKMKI